MSHEPFETLTAVYAVGALDGEERRQLEEHLAQGCAQCEAALREHGETLAALARTLPPVVPPPDVKEALLRRLGATAPRGADVRRGRLGWLVATAAAVVVTAWLTGAFVAARYEARLGQMARETAALHQRLERDIGQLNEQLAVYRSAAELLADPETQVVALHGLGPSPTATGRVLWHPRRGGRVFVANLPAAPAGKAYELWTIADGAPRPAGVFRVDTSGRGSHAVAPVAGDKPVKVFAVTLEPEEGVPAPTGPMVLASR